MSEVKNIPRLRFPEFKEQWRIKRLGQIGNFIGGGTPDRTNSTYWNGEIPWISSSDIIEDNIHLIYQNQTITHEGLKNSATKIIPKNSVIIVSRVGLGKIAINEVELCTSQDFTNLIPEYDSPYFLGYQFEKFKNKFVSLGQGTSIKGFTTSDLKLFKVNIPSLPEQQKIADFLTAVDKRIELLEKKKTLLETYKKGVMKKIFNQEIRFKDDNGKDFPDWMRKKIEEITIRISTGLNPRKNFSLGNGDNYYVTIKNISNGKIDFSTCEKIDDEALVKIKNRSDLSRDDIIMSSIGNIGESYLLTSDPINWNINESVFMLRPNQELINPVFFYYILTNDNANRYFLGNMTGSSFKSIKIGDLREMPVSIPSLIEQKKISKFLKSIDNQIELVENQIDKSKTWKKGLLQKMFV